MTKKILIGSRHGGHAASIDIIKDILTEEYENPEFTVITDPQDYFDYEFAEAKYEIPGFRETGQDKLIKPIKFFRNIYRSLKVLITEKPDIIVAAGANTSFPIAFIGGLIFRKKIIAVEAKNRTQNPSKTPKMLSRLKNTEVWVSHDSMLDEYHTDNVINKNILESQDFEQYKSNEKTEKLLIVPSSGDKKEIKQKYGLGLPRNEFLSKLGKTEKVITRAGNTAYEAAKLSDKVIVVPYPDPQNHQENFGKWLSQNFENVELKQGKFKDIIEEETK